MIDDREIVTSVLKGDYRAFELLVKQYQKLVYFIVFRLVKNKEDNEDVCQEVFIKVHTSLNRFAFESKLSTWIATIAYHTAINYIRKHNKNQASSYTDDMDNYHFTTETPEYVLEKKSESEYINQLILQMPVNYRTVVTLYHLNEFSCNEIQEITGIPEGSVKSYLFRARQLLKDKMKKDIKFLQYERR